MKEERAKDSTSRVHWGDSVWDQSGIKSLTAPQLSPLCSPFNTYLTAI